MSIANKNELIIHPFEPFFDADSKVLILGTMPSPKSREVRFYYGHPQNRFWRLLADLFSEPVLNSLDQKKDFLTRHNIALWDVFASCEIQGANDASIRNAVPNDLNRIFTVSQIRAVFTNGQKASSAYKKFVLSGISIPWHPLPSTSPANCRNWSYETLKEAYKILLNYV